MKPVTCLFAATQIIISLVLLIFNFLQYSARIHECDSDCQRTSYLVASSRAVVRKQVSTSRHYSINRKSHIMDYSPFSKLSPELRNQIYDLCLAQYGEVNITDTEEWDFIPCWEERHQKQCHRLALAQTCSQMRQESAGIFYGSATFRIMDNTRESYDGLCALEILTDSLHHHSKSQTQPVVFDIGRIHSNTLNYGLADAIVGKLKHIVLHAADHPTLSFIVRLAFCSNNFSHASPFFVVGTWELTTTSRELLDEVALELDNRCKATSHPGDKDPAGDVVTDGRVGADAQNGSQGASHEARRQELC